MLSRRAFTVAITALAVRPWDARAQAKRGVPRVGVLWHAANAEEEGPYFRGLMQGFKDLGYVEGRDVVLEHRFPNELPDRFAAMAAELVALKVDVLVGVGASSSQYVKNATSSIPIIFMYVPDPVGSKFVESLGRPGGNATGLTNSAVELSTKRLQYFRELIPGMTRIGLLVNPNARITRLYIDEAKAASTKFGLTIQIFEAGTLNELDGVFDAMVKARMDGLMINSEGLFFVGREKIAQLALARRLPLCVWSRETVEAGALMSYGPDQIAISRRVAVYVDKILKGAKPAEIPVEQPTRFEFLVNGKTAAALKIKLAQTTLARADEVIR